MVRLIHGNEIYHIVPEEIRYVSIKPTYKKDVFDVNIGFKGTNSIQFTDISKKQIIPVMKAYYDVLGVENHNSRTYFQGITVKGQK